MQKPSYEQALDMAKRGELHQVDIALESFVDPQTKNHFFVVYDPDTGKKVLTDKYAKVVECEGIALPVLESPKIDKFLARVFKKIQRGVVGILSITDEPILRELAAILKVDLSEIDILKADLINKEALEQVLILIKKYGSDRSQEIGAVVEDALLDGRINLVEWKRIYDVVRKKR